jgi:hypothetical protein
MSNLIGRIDRSGFLHINRAGLEKPQVCPWTIAQENKFTSCGDHCPHFGEPRRITLSGWDAILNICHGKELIFDILTDDRDKKVPPDKEKT